MVDDSRSTPDDVLRGTAAKWVARMQRPDAERYRREFEAWLAADPSHRAAYNKASSRFHDARMLAHSTRWARTRSGKPRRTALTLSFCMVLLVSTVLLAWRITTPALDIHDEPSNSGPARPATASLAIDNRRGAIDRHILPDGSVATLDTATHMRVRFSAGSRDLWLDRGRVRFAVAHDGRPFVVHVDGGTVTATGTLFDVVVTADRQVRVALLEGSIRVRSSDEPGDERALRAGEAVNFRIGDVLPLPVAIDEPTEQWTSGMMSFDAAPLHEVIASANLYAARPIAIADPILGDIQVSGRFRIDDADRLATNLAQDLGLTVRHESDGSLLLAR